MLDVCAVFDDPNASHEMISEAGNKLFIILYGGKKTHNLVTLRKAKIAEMMVKSKHGLKPEKAPPTPDAANLHAYRVFYQVMDWKHLSDTEMKPEEWGWQVQNNKLQPIMMKQVNVYIFSQTK